MLSGLFGKLGFWAIVVLVALFFVWGIARNWSCREPRQPRDRSATISGEVVKVLAGNRLTLRESAGVLGRRTRDVEIRLSGIGVLPPNEPLGAAAKEKLAELLPVGSTPEVDLDDRRDDDGVVWTAGRTCCQLRLLELGLAALDGSEGTPADWTAAEKASRKAKVGIWK